MANKVQGGAPIRGSAEPPQGPQPKPASVISDPANTADIRATNPFQVKGKFTLPNGLSVNTK